MSVMQPAMRSLVAALLGGWLRKVASSTNTGATCRNYTGPDTGDEVSIQWDIAATWSEAKVVHYNPETDQHKMDYENTFINEAKLVPGEWKFLETRGSPELPVQNVGSSDVKESIVGKRIRVYWEPYVKWHDGVVRQCDVKKGCIGDCTVEFEGMGTHTYDFSNSKVQWRTKFKMDPDLWTFPANPAFNSAINFMEIDVDTEVMKKIQAWYEHHVLSNINVANDTFSSVDQDGGPDLVWYRQFAGGKFGSDIKWISPVDMRTHGLMSDFFHELGVGQHVSPYMDLTPNNTERRLRVYIPSWVVRTKVGKSYMHMDWPAAGGSNGLTLMTPLYDMSNQTEGCNLLYQKGITTEGPHYVYKYRFGKAAIFGGGTRHSSQPCKPRNAWEKARPWAFLCFNFGTDRMEYWETLRKNIECTGKVIVKPDGTEAEPASCKSYNEGLKEAEAKFKAEELAEAASRADEL